MGNYENEEMKENFSFSYVILHAHKMETNGLLYLYPSNVKLHYLRVWDNGQFQMAFSLLQFRGDRKREF